MSELRGSTRARALIEDRRGGARAGSGRKAGGKNRPRSWDSIADDVRWATRKHFRRAKLLELAKADEWRFWERIAGPLLIRSQPAVLAVKADEGQMALPLVFVDVPQVTDDRGREAALLGGSEPVEAEYRRE